MKKYDYIIVLCASQLNNGQFDDVDNRGNYLGGNVRMEAATKLKNLTNKIVVVGGGIEKDDQEIWRKTNDMYKYLLENGISPKIMIRVASASDTTGNLRAVYKCLKKKLYSKKVGILTNYYHLPRALTFAADIFDNEKIIFKPIAAESLIGGFPFKYWPQLISRIQGELTGLSDWSKGIYDEQKIPKRKWLGEINKEDIKKI